ncbi:hypothetical protein MRB53_037608 [Persea americana]|nr:hypothetical protein MRB53_037608 [Persea americana]
MSTAGSHGLLSAHVIRNIYVPSAIIIFGTALVKLSWVPVAIAVAGIIGAWSYSTTSPASGKSGSPVPVLKPDVYQKFKLSEKTVLSHNTAIYRFALPKSTDILGLPIGQHISLAATIAGQEKEVVRSYTPISSDEENKGHFDLLIKSYPTGNISKYVSEMTVGDYLKVKGPKGAMVYTPNMVRHFGMIAGGTGITPMLQVIRAIIRGRPQDKTQVDLLFANVNKDDILLKDQLDKLAAEDSGFRVHYVLNNPPEGWNGGVGFVTPEMIKVWRVLVWNRPAADCIQEKLPAAASDVKILICGPPPMVSAMKKATESLGFAKARPVSKLEDQVFCF